MEYPSQRRTCFAGAGAMPAWNANPVERLDLFFHAHSRAVTQSLFWTEVRIESISLNYVKITHEVIFDALPFGRLLYGDPSAAVDYDVYDRLSLALRSAARGGLPSGGKASQIRG